MAFFEYRKYPRGDKKRKVQLCSCGCGIVTASNGKINSSSLESKKHKDEIFLKGHEKRGMSGYVFFIKNKIKRKEERWSSGKLMPSVEEIVEYNKDWITEGKFKVKLNNAEECCWACGRNGFLERAHVIPRRYSKNNNPKNIWLLCSECHLIQPDAASVENQLRWIKQMPLYQNDNDYLLETVNTFSKRWGFETNTKGMPLTDHPYIEEIFALWVKLQFELKIIKSHKSELALMECRQEVK